MKPYATYILAAGGALLLLAAAYGVSQIVPAIRPAVFPAPEDITSSVPPAGAPTGNQTGMPLSLPDGFAISVYARDLPGARVMRFDSSGHLWLSRTSEGAVTKLEVDPDTGLVARQTDVYRDLRRPHGLAFAPGSTLLYVAEEHKIWRAPAYGEGEKSDVIDLPAGGGHFTRSIGFGPDGKLYATIGSSCNVCEENDERRAAMLRIDPSTGESRLYARGLRNTVFFTWDAAGRIWGTDMGRDWLGDDLPPDEINVITDAFIPAHFGWPYCYGDNVHDADFDRRQFAKDPCAPPDYWPPKVNLPAHSAPLGLAFVPDSWPEKYRGDLLVALHGSWNRSQPTGYKIILIQLDDYYTVQGIDDFIDGWLTPDGALGRPVDLAFDGRGNLFVSDDKAGVIYRVSPPAAAATP